MSAKNKKLIISGILLFAAVACRALYLILLNINYDIVFWDIISPVIGEVILMSYCFIFNKIKAGSIVCYAGLGIMAVSHILYFPSFVGVINTLSAFFELAVIIVIIVAKAKSSKGISTVGTIIFGVYAILLFFTIASDILFGYINAFTWLSLIIPIVELIALFNIWSAENSIIPLKNRSHQIIKTSLEDDLVSLKQLYDRGAITEQEYNLKKADILKKL